MANAFWYAKTGDKAGMYAIGLGNVEIAIITAPDDALAVQWTQCMANALNAREARLRAYAAIEQESARRDAHNEAMADKWDKHADHDCLPDWMEE
jgi:hypothetical protein